MNKLNNFEKAALAQAFSDKFGARESISRDEFDMFIIDKGLAPNIGDVEIGSAEHTGFVQKRSQAKRFLNTAAKLIEGESYGVEVNRNNKEVYDIVSWEEAAEGRYKTLANATKRVVKGRVADIEKLKSAAETRYQLATTPEGEAMAKQSMDALALAKGSALVFQKETANAVLKYNHNIDLITKKVEAMLEVSEAKDAEALEDKSNVSNIDGINLAS